MLLSSQTHAHTAGGGVATHPARPATLAPQVEKEAEQIAKAVKTTYTVNQTKKDPFDSVTDKVGYRVGLDPVTLPDDKDVKEVVAGLLAGDKIPQVRGRTLEEGARLAGTRTPLAAHLAGAGKPRDRRCFDARMPSL